MTISNTCGIAGCEEIHYAKSYCRKHYRQNKYGKLGVVGERKCEYCEKSLGIGARPDRKFCGVTCQFAWHRRHGCYATDRLTETQPKCSQLDCGNPVISGDLCRLHYMRKWRTGDPQKVRRNKRSGFTTCTADGCAELGRWKGLCERHYAADYLERNKAYFAAHNAGRRHQMRAFQWAALKDRIRPFYEEAARLTVQTGVPHVVDHIVPLKGRSVWGLHVPWNLRVVTDEANRAKYNQFDQEAR